MKHLVQKEIRSSYLNYVNGIIISPSGDGNLSCNKKFWLLMKHLKSDNVTIPTLMDNGVKVSDDLNKAEC